MGCQCDEKICGCKLAKKVKRKYKAHKFTVLSPYVSTSQDDLPLGRVQHLRRSIKENSDTIIGLANGVRAKAGGLEKHHKYRAALRKLQCRSSLTRR